MNLILFALAFMAGLVAGVGYERKRQHSLRLDRESKERFESIKEKVVEANKVVEAQMKSVLDEASLLPWEHCNLKVCQKDKACRHPTNVLCGTKYPNNKHQVDAPQPTGEANGQSTGVDESQGRSNGGVSGPSKPARRKRNAGQPGTGRKKGAVRDQR